VYNPVDNVDNSNMRTDPTCNLP